MTSAPPIERTILAERLGTATPGKRGQQSPGLLGLRARRLPRRIERAGAAHDVDDLGQARHLAVLDGVADQRRVPRREPRSIAISSGSVGLPSRRSSPTFLPSCAVAPS